MATSLNLSNQVERYSYRTATRPVRCYKRHDVEDPHLATPNGASICFAAGKSRSSRTTLRPLRGLRSKRHAIIVARAAIHSWSPPELTLPRHSQSIRLRLSSCSHRPSASEASGSLHCVANVLIGYQVGEWQR